MAVRSTGGPYEVDDVYSVIHMEGVPFSVYPNPARDVVQLDMNEMTLDAVMSIYDASGRLMWSRTAERWMERSPWMCRTGPLERTTSKWRLRKAWGMHHLWFNIDAYDGETHSA